jgi:predicted RNase H-like nuclease
MRVAGVDGCRTGWVVASADVGSEGRLSTIEVAVVPPGAALADERFARIAIDIPIGLPEAGCRRAADTAARRLLGRRGVSVFSAPPREALSLPSFDHPDRPALGLTLQAWAIVPKIGEIDRALPSGAQYGDAAGDRPAILEAHPEVLFRDLAGSPVFEPKKTAAGRLRRIELLRCAVGPGFAMPSTPRGAAVDDVIDALACLWLAAAPDDDLYALPELPEPERDRRGVRMEIWRRRWSPCSSGSTVAGPVSSRGRSARLSPRSGERATTWCWCGCGGATRLGAAFLAGHDRVAEAAAIRSEYGSLVEFLRRHGYGPAPADRHARDARSIRPSGRQE